ncbi:hypothetical protein HID58_070513 [Brassica napus]|uniref:ADP,ATP carrier protein n=1 Tax=Brassica napus TaxID=3708 RepID=A0ABQ7YYX9_BRANA|nr:hypothetical protein HID58_070513 [Brassica napus]
MVAAMHHLDVVRTRFQDAFRTIMKEEEPIAFYKGIVPGLALFPQQVSHGAIQFTAYEELHKVIVYSIGKIENLNPLIIYW